jgi:hypothetical protein
MGYKDERMFAEGGETGKKLKGYRVYVFESSLSSSQNVLKGDSYVLVTDGIQGDSSQVDSDEIHLKLVKRNLFGKEYLHAEPVNVNKRGNQMFGGKFVWSTDSRFRDDISESPIQLHDRVESYAVGGEIGNTVSFKGDYGTPRSGVVKEKRGSSYIVATDDGDRLVDSYEVISFSETPIAKKKRFGFFAEGGEIQSKIDKLQSVVNSKMLPESVKEKARKQIAELEKELHESKETKAEEKAEHKAGGSEYKSKIEKDLEKELHRLQRDLNSSRLQTYIEGDNSEEEKARQRERTSKIIRMNEVLSLLNEIEIGKENKMTNESEFSKDELNRLIRSFEEINDFYEENKKEPIEESDMGERQLFYRLKGLREQDNKIDILLPYDKFNLLKETKAEEKDYVEAKVKNLEASLKDKTISEAQRKRDEKELALFKKATATTKKPTTRKAPIKKAVAKKVVVKKEEPKPKFKVGDILRRKNMRGDGFDNLKIEAVTGWTGEEHRYDIVFLDDKLNSVNRYAKGYDSEFSAIPKPKADHKKLVAKLKAKKGAKEYDNRASLNTETGERRKRSESSDKKRTALPLGKRVSADGSVYYENRLNRADMNKQDKFKEGGEVKGSDWGLNLNW